MITKNEVIKLCDFSLSRIAAVPHFSYTPEDPKERERSGCLLGEFVLGEALFNGESEIEQLFKIFKLTGSPSKEVMEQI